jgi:hypothetical protein
LKKNLSFHPDFPMHKEMSKRTTRYSYSEDNASSHAHYHQNTIYAIYNITRLLWPGSSPDLNAIEPAWFWLKRRTTAQGAPQNRKIMKKAWIQAWQDLPQEQIQQ